MINIRKIIFLTLTVFLLNSASVYAIRIKDLADIKGVRNNQLVGYGLVVGLDGTGDDDKTQFTYQSLASMLNKMGIVVDPEDMDVDNVAAVMVTATLPPFAKVGSKIDIVISSIGNSETLQGGTLLMTPLKGPDGAVYAVAQGPISIGGFSFSGASGDQVQKNHPTVGSIPGGAIIEKEINLELKKRTTLEICLKNPDFTTSLRVKEAIERNILSGISTPIDAGTVSVMIPPGYDTKIVNFISKIENLSVTPDIVAKVVLNERTGTIVMGENVLISTIAVSHGNLSLIIKEDQSVSQPLPFSRGRTAVVPESDVEVSEQKSELILINKGINIGDVIAALNAIGVSPRDLIAILQSIKASGALQAELVII